jgi:predicted metal-binding protein
MFQEWGKGFVLRFIELEREVFLSDYYKTFLISFDPCGLSETCVVDRTKCKNPNSERTWRHHPSRISP